jgi:hypothetical protein
MKRDVRRPHPRRVNACGVTGLERMTSSPEHGSRRRGVQVSMGDDLTGPLPAELGTMDALAQTLDTACVCVPSPLPTLWFTCAGPARVQTIHHHHSHLSLSSAEG